MSDPDDRYESRSGDPPLAFERRRRDRPRGPAPVTLIVSVLLLLVVGGAVFYMYRTGVRSPSDGPQPLGAPLGDVRGPAPPQTRAPDPAAGLTIAKDDPNAAPAPTRLAPGPEEPLSDAPSHPPAAAPPAQAPNAGPKGIESPLPPPPPPPKDVKPLKPAVAAPADTPRNAPARGESAKPARKVASIDDLIDAAPANRAAKAVKTSKPAAAPAASDSGGSFTVQIGAFSTPALADKEWSKAAAVAPGAMAGKGKRVAPLERDGGVLYRTSITGFSSRDQAVALCDRLKAAGGACFVH